MELKEVFEPVLNFVKNFQKKDKEPASKQAAKDRLKLVLMQDRASVSPDFFDMMKKELIDVIKKYIEIDEESLEVELTRGVEVGLEGPALYANIPIKNVKPVAPQGEETSELYEEQIDAAAEEILNNLERVAQRNKEELRAGNDTQIDEESDALVTPTETTIEPEKIEETTDAIIEQTESEYQENTEILATKENIEDSQSSEIIEKATENIEKIETEVVTTEEKPKATIKKRASAIKRTTKKKKEA